MIFVTIRHLQTSNESVTELWNRPIRATQLRSLCMIDSGSSGYHTQPIITYDRTSIDLCRNEISSAIFCDCIHLPDLSTLGRSITNRGPCFRPRSRRPSRSPILVLPFSRGMLKVWSRRRAGLRSIDRSADNEIGVRPRLCAGTCARLDKGVFPADEVGDTSAIPPTLCDRSISDAIDAALSCRAPDLTVGTERLRLRLKSRNHSRGASERAGERATARERTACTSTAYCTI